MTPNQTTDPIGPDSPVAVFCICVPGGEHILAQELGALGYGDLTITVGGVTVQTTWSAVPHMNMWLRTATRVLVRIGEFRAMHLAQLDKRARKFDWGAVLKPDVPIKVDVTCKKSRIYHAGAARQRIEGALTDAFGGVVSENATQLVKVRIEDDLCTISVDTSGAALHQRNHKTAVNKAPMRETLAALFLKAAGYTGAEPVVDPMCGSGTFPIEAAEIAAGLAPGRSRDFAFSNFAMPLVAPDRPVPQGNGLRFYGYDRDAGAIKMSKANADRAGVADCTEFLCQPVSDLRPPTEAAGLVIANPPYGARIGNRKQLFSVYGAFGQVLKSHFAGWRAAIVTSDPGLAKATGLPFTEKRLVVPHGGLKVTLYQTKPLKQSP